MMNDKLKKIKEEASKIELKELLSKGEDGSLSIVSKMNEFFDGLNVKLMGSYEEIEAYEKEKESKKSA